MDRPDVNQQITWVYTHSLETTRAFYGQVLGLDCVRDQSKAQILRTSSGAMIGVCEVFGDRVVEPQGGIYTFFAEDPNGYVIEFRQFLDTE